MRLFFAIDLDPDTRAAAVAHQDNLRSRIERQGVKFVKTEKLHLTILFLGEVDESIVPAIVAAGSSVAAKCSTMNLRLHGLGGFPDEARPKSIWIGVGDPQEAVATISCHLTEVLRDLVVLKDQSVSPHVTLARVSPASKKVGFAIRPLIEEARNLPPQSFQAASLSLFCTEKDGTYRPVHVWDLG